jgi:hypothetical protein
MGVTEPWLTLIWLDFITESSDLRKELRRGRILARKDKVQSMEVRPGLITAEVLLDNGSSVTVRIRQPVIAVSEWKLAIGKLIKNAGFSAELLQGRVSEGMVEIFHESGIDLYPYDLTDIKNFCSCGTGPVCVHSIATHLKFAKALAAAPLLLFTFRGLPKEKLMGALRRRRSVRAKSGRPGRRPRVGIEPITSIEKGYWSRGSVPVLSFHFETGEREANGLHVVQALGPGPAQLDPAVMADVLAPIIKIARSRLKEFAEFSSDSDVVGAGPTIDEQLLLEAQKEKEITVEYAARHLSLPLVDARKYLKWLVQDGRMEEVTEDGEVLYRPCSESEGP